MRIEVSFSSLYPPWPKMYKIANHIDFSIQNKFKFSPKNIFPQNKLCPKTEQNSKYTNVKLNLR